MTAVVFLYIKTKAQHILSANTMPTNVEGDMYTLTKILNR